MKLNFQRQKKITKRQRGFLSIEIIVVLVVVLGLLGLGASKMDMLSSNSDNTTDITNIQALYTAAKATKSTTGYGASATDLVPLLISMGSVPANIVISGGTLLNPYGGTYAIASTVSGFTITSSAVPTANCIKVASSISKGGIFATTKFNTGTATAGEITPSAASTGCNVAAGNTITFTSAS